MHGACARSWPRVCRGLAREELARGLAFVQDYKSRPSMPSPMTSTFLTDHRRGEGIE